MQYVKPRHIVCVIVTALLAFILGVLVGYFSYPRSDKEESDLIKTLNRKEDYSITSRIRSTVDISYIDRMYRTFTRHPGLAGTPQQKRNAEFIVDLWRKQGLDANIVQYNVLLSYPKANHTNRVSIVNLEGVEEFTSASSEKQLSPEETPEDVVQPFNAFAASGHVQGDIVYANYARLEDFKKLEENNISVRGKIVIARYGRIFRGNKLKLAEDAGSIGLILFSDPTDYNPLKANDTFPQTWWLPETGVQRGNVVLIKGDQSTLGYPSTDYAYRAPADRIKKQLPRIPCHPIGYKDAHAILSAMEGRPAWTDWQGGLNITYRISGMASGKQIKLNVENENLYRPIYNVIGRIKGYVEPDRAVITGVHRDAWVYGSADPISGTTTLMETVRIFAKLIKEGWRPRRTIVVCSWDAEEYGLVGSYEWVEEHMKWIQKNVVAYINNDSPVSGNYTFSSKTSPLLRNAVYEATKKVPDPRKEQPNLYEAWRNAYKMDKPLISAVGSGSDHTPFIANAGVTVSYSKFSGYGKVWFSGTSPLYHTRYEQQGLIEMIDPDYKFTRSMVIYSCELLRDIADSVILPFNVVDYARDINISVQVLQAYRDEFDSANISVGHLEKAFEKFSKSAEKFQDSLSSININHPLQVRRANDILQAIEGAFLDENGLPMRPMYKHILQSPSGINHYGGTGFPGLEDLIHLPADDPDKWDRVKHHLAAITYAFYSASELLTDF